MTFSGSENISCSNFTLDMAAMAAGKPSVWTFINNSKATETASLKQLQQFVLSLDAKELRQLISVYLRSVVGKHQHQNELTLKSAVGALLNNVSNTNTDHVTDASILHKMQLQYGNECGKKVLSKMQQKRNSNHILATSAQVMASAFQFLSFKELCSIQPTCCFFVYLRTKYSALCHYHINLDHTYVS